MDVLVVSILSSLSGLILPIDVVNDRGISKSPENVLAHSKCSKHSGDAFGHLQVVKIKSWAQRNEACARLSISCAQTILSSWRPLSQEEIWDAYGAVTCP